HLALDSLCDFHRVFVPITKLPLPSFDATLQTRRILNLSSAPHSPPGLDPSIKLIRHDGYVVPEAFDRLSICDWVHFLMYHLDEEYPPLRQIQRLILNMLFPNILC